MWQRKKEKEIGYRFKESTFLSLGVSHLDLGLGVELMVMHMLDLASVAASNPSAEGHDDRLHSQDNTSNDEGESVAGVDIVLEGRGVVERVVVDDRGAADIASVLLLGGSENDDGDEVEDGDNDGCGPPKDGEVLGQGVDLAQHTQHAAETHKTVDTSSNVSSDF